MKYLKMLGLGGVAATVLMAFAGTALATIVTAPAGTQMQKGEFVKGSSGVVSFDGAFTTISCQKASGEGIITDAGSSTETVKGEIFLGTFSECNFPVVVKKTGTSEVHTVSGSADGKGTLTSSNAEVEVKTSVGSCIFTTSNTHIGEVVGGSPAVLNFNSAKIPRTGGNFLCGSSGTMTGQMTVTSPKTLLID
jgi:hypothetical protein